MRKLKSDSEIDPFVYSRRFLEHFLTKQRRGGIKLKKKREKECKSEQHVNDGGLFTS